MSDIDTTETLTKKFQHRGRSSIQLREMARQARGAAARWSKRSSAWARVGDFRHADSAELEAVSLWRMAEELDEEVSVKLRDAARRYR